MSRISYGEGTWFGVPLRTGGFAAGLIARQGKGGCLFGYFFGPILKVPPPKSVVEQLHPEDSVHQAMFGDLNLRKGLWPIIGQEQNWDRNRWPMLPFFRGDDTEGKAWLSYYSEDDLSFLREESCDLRLASNYPPDRLAGAGALEIRLTKILTTPRA